MGAEIRIASTLEAVTGGQKQNRGIRSCNAVRIGERLCSGETLLLVFRKPELLYSQPL